MPVRPALKLNVGGVLAVDVAEPGIVTGATVTIYDRRGLPVVANAPATVSGSRLSYAVAGNVADAVGTWRAEWVYTAGGVPSERQQLFDVARSVLRPTLTTAGLFSRYGLLSGMTGRVSARDAIDAAWVDVFDAVEAAGSKPNLIIDPRPLETAHAAFAAWRYALNLRAGSAATGDEWQAWAEERYSEGKALLTSALEHLDWYDANDDLKPNDDELQANRGRRILTR